MDKNTDLYWEMFARSDPYWAVITYDMYKSKNMNEEHKKHFFETGVQYVESIHEVIKRYIDPDFHGKNALDFGCGVGRVLIPLAQRGYSVTGIDVSETMLALCEENLKDTGAKDFRLLKEVDDQALVDKKFDLVNTFIALQHIPFTRGLKLIPKLLDLVSQKGVGIIHITYYPIKASENRMVKLKSLVKDQILKHKFLNVLYEKIKKRQLEIPMPLYGYPLNEIFWMIQSRGFNNVYMRFSDHGKFKGLFLFIQRNEEIPHTKTFK